MKYLLILITILLLRTPDAMAQVAVIAHKSVPVNTIEKITLLDFYTGDIRVWEDDNPVVVFDLKPKSELKKSFYKFLGKTTSRMKSIWMKKMLAGEVDPPTSIETEEEILRKVATTPGAIGFVSRTLVNGEVKTLLLIDAVP